MPRVEFEPSTPPRYWIGSLKESSSPILNSPLPDSQPVTGDTGIGNWQLDIGTSNTEQALSALETRLGVALRNREILRQALRHRSLTLEVPLTSNERLEFLGDSIVGVVICDYLFARFPDLSEGELAKRKAY